MSLLRHTRFGRFEVSAKAVENWPLEVMVALQDVIIVRAEFDYSRLRLEYTGISPHFDEAEEFTVIPEYTLVLRSDGNHRWEMGEGKRPKPRIPGRRLGLR